MYWILPSTVPLNFRTWCQVRLGDTTHQHSVKTVPLNGEDEFKCTPQLIVKKWCEKICFLLLLPKVFIQKKSQDFGALFIVAQWFFGPFPRAFPPSTTGSLCSAVAHTTSLAFPWLSGPFIQPNAGLVSGKPEPGTALPGGSMRIPFTNVDLSPDPSRHWDESMIFRPFPVLVGDVWSFPGPEDFSA